MTDKQKAIFEKMLEGKIHRYDLTNNRSVYFQVQNDRYVQLTGESNKDWEDYEKAWEVYKSLPLIKALG